MEHRVGLQSFLPLRTLATSNTAQNLSVSPKAKGCGRVSSPMTNLTLNLSELSTGRVTPRRKLSLSCLDTPDTADRPAADRSISIESGCFVDSPSPIDSPTLEMSLKQFYTATSKSDVTDPPTKTSRRRNNALRRFNSMPVPTMRLSEYGEEKQVHIGHQSTPHTSRDVDAAALNMSCSVSDVASDSDTALHTSSSSEGSSASSAGHPDKQATFFLDDSCSQDSGLEADRADSRDSKDCEDGFMFAAPKGLPLRRHVKMISEDTCSPFKYSPVKHISPSKRRNSFPVGSLDFSGEFVQKPTTTEDGESSPLKICRLTSVDEGLGDDGFLDIMDAEVAALTSGDGQGSGSSAMSSLFNAPLLNKKTHVTSVMQEDDDTPVTRRVMCRRNINRSMSMDVRPQRMSFKRDQPDSDDSPIQQCFKRDPPQDESTPIQQLKRMRPSSMLESPTTAASRPSLHRCHSESEAMIKSALARQADEPDLLGDCSKTYCLPIMKGKHQDLKSISCETVSHILDGHYGSEVDQAFIIDCRYPYEYEGGHIQGAKNIYTAEQIMEKFLKNPITSLNPSKRVILIFHCEFSSERAPKLCRFLRSQDRQMNKECYPRLHYPELYLLEGGYKAYFETEKHHCLPPMYKPMLHKDHADDLRHFRTKSKSWAGEQRATRPGFRPLKF